MVAPYFEKSIKKVLIVCVEHDYGRHAKVGDLRLVPHPILVVRTGSGSTTLAKWRYATDFEKEVFYNDIETVRQITKI